MYKNKKINISLSFWFIVHFQLIPLARPDDLVPFAIVPLPFLATALTAGVELWLHIVRVQVTIVTKNPLIFYQLRYLECCELFPLFPEQKKK